MTPAQPADPSPYVLGIMRLEVEGRDSAAFRALVEDATARLGGKLHGEGRLPTRSLRFDGPNLTPGVGTYAPLDFLQIGLAEKVERRVDFLLIVTEVDLSSSSLAYTLALTSRLTNVSVISTKRLDPGFWGESPSAERAGTRLAALMRHCFGHLLNLPHAPDPGNAMYPLEGVEDLDAMGAFTPAQLATMRARLPREAHERSARTGRLAFTLGTLVRDAPAIGRAVAQANPFRLLSRMPTMLAAALSVIVVLLFGAETWDVASAVTIPQIAGFSLASLATATFVLYRAFAFDALLGRDRRLTESTVVTAAATLLSLGATLVVMFALFGGLMYAAIVTVFPERLMSAWVSDGEAVRPLDHLKLSLFLAGMGVLAGSLGGRSDSRDLVRGVLFISEES